MTAEATTAAVDGDQVSAERVHGVSLAEAFRVWLRIAALSFGGPAGQIAVMHRILVEEKRWIGDRRFLHALNYCMLLPGPEAQQLAIYIGWLMHGTVGGILAGGLFILPGLLAIMALSWVYVLAGGLGLVAALLFGAKAAVLAIVLQAVVRIGRRALRSTSLKAIAASAFVLIFLFGVPFPAIVLGAAALGYLGGRSGWQGLAPGAGHGQGRGSELLDADSLLGLEASDRLPPTRRRTFGVAGVWFALWLAPVAALLLLLGPGNVFTEVATFFSAMAVVTFGGAYAVLAYVAQEAVHARGWLSPGEMLDGLGMAETTPGPLIMVLQFVGFLAAYRDPGALQPLLAGSLGGLLATWVTFAPCFLWIFLGAPYVERLRDSRGFAGALAAITAAVVGVILNLSVWFTIHTVFREVHRLHLGLLQVDVPVPGSLDAWALLLTAAALVAVFHFKAGILPTLAAACAAGAVLFAAGLVG